LPEHFHDASSSLSIEDFQLSKDLGTEVEHLEVVSSCIGVNEGSKFKEGAVGSTFAVTVNVVSTGGINEERGHGWIISGRVGDGASIEVFKEKITGLHRRIS
jgi:hypothetical protein